MRNFLFVFILVALYSIVQAETKTPTSGEHQSDSTSREFYLQEALKHNAEAIRIWSELKDTFELLESLDTRARILYAISWKNLDTLGNQHPDSIFARIKAVSETHRWPKQFIAASRAMGWWREQPEGRDPIQAASHLLNATLWLVRVGDCRAADSLIHRVARNAEQANGLEKACIRQQITRCLDEPALLYGYRGEREVRVKLEQLASQLQP